MRSKVIPKIPEQLLSYNLGDRETPLQKAAEELDIKYTVIPLDKAGESVGLLAGYPGFTEKGTREYAEGECLIFSGITSARLGEVLKKLKHIDLPLKAVVTEYNQRYSVAELITELEAERAAIGKGRK